MPPWINPSYIKTPPGMREVLQWNRKTEGKLLIFARRIALEKCGKYADSYRDCPTTYLRHVDGTYRAQIENAKYGEKEDLWDEYLRPIRGVPHFNAKDGENDSGPKYTGDKLTDLELLLGYYLHNIRVHHRSALQTLFRKPSSVHVVTSVNPKVIIPPPWLPRHEIPFTTKGSPQQEMSRLLTIILSRNDMYNGTYHWLIDKRHLTIRAAFEALAMLIACVLAYYAIPWAYSELNKENRIETEPSSERQRPASEFAEAPRSKEEKPPTTAIEQSSEIPAETTQQPTGRWAHIRSAISRKG